MKRHLLVLVALLFWFGGMTAQTNFIHQDSVFARASDCTLGVAVCIDSIAYDNINDLRFYVDGQQYSTQFTPCLVNTIHNYSYSDIFRGGENGPWRLDSWTVNGQTYSGTFNNLQTLLDSMRRWNPSGNWQLENSARIIYGYVAASTTYSCQEIFGTSRGGQSQVCYNSGVEYRGLRFNVPVGIHQLIVEKVRTGERDTVTLLAACLKPETIRRTVSVGSNAVYCASQADLLGTLTTTRNFCPRTVNAITFGTPQTTCIRYTGTTVGTDTACVEVCDRYGFCDTTYLIVTAATGTGSSLSLSDTISVGLRRTTCEVALPTGTINSFTNTCAQNSGTSASFELDFGTNCVTYRGLTVGTDTACLRVCNTEGVCATTTLTIQTIPLVNPVSPTSFTFTDTLTVGLSRNKCSFNAPTGAITIFENICPTSSGTNVLFTLDQATKCVTYRSLAIGVDTACMRVCNAALQCDTTYIYVSAIINGNGGGTNNGTGRTITVRDTISIGGSRENCGVSIPSSIVSIVNDCPQSSGTNVAFLIDPTRRCVTYRGLTIGSDTACYVVCNASGVCDTTIYIVGTVDTANKGKTIIIRDTISVGLTRADCRVSIPRGTFAYITNNCVASSGTNVSFVYSSTTRCADYTGLLVGTDTACVVVCNTAGICDTTILIITAIENTSGGGNSCGLRVTPTVQVRSCGITGFIMLATSGSTSPYTYRWADLTGTNQPSNRTGLEAGTYTVTVSPSVPNCDINLTIVVANNAINCGGIGTNRCGLAVVPTAVSKTCTANGAISLAVTGSTAPYTFVWSDSTLVSNPQARTNLAAGTYTVKVTPSVPNCDTTLSIIVANTATNCGGNTCGLVVSSTAIPKTCAARGSITLAVSGGTAPYSYNWADLNGASFPQNRTNLEAGIYVVTITSSSANCDTTLRITVANDSTNCPLSRSRLDSVTVFVQDSTTYCVDSSRVLGGFSVFLSSPQIFSLIDRATPVGCFKIKGFVTGRDTALIVLNGQNGFRDTVRLVIRVVPRPILTQRSDTISIKVLETRIYCPDTSRLRGSPVNLIKFCSIDPFNNTTIRLDTVSKCVAVTGVSTGQDTFCIAVCNAAGFCDTTTLFVNVTRDTVTPQYRTDTVRLFVGDSLLYCNIDTGMIRGVVDSIYNHCLTGSGRSANVEITPAKCLKIKGLAVGTDSACIVVLNRLANLRDTTKVIIVVTKRDTNTVRPRVDSITVQVNEQRIYCPDTSRLAGGRVTSISTCSPVSIDNTVIFLVNSTKCVEIDGLTVGRDTVCLVVCNVNNVCDTVTLHINVVPQRPLASSTVIVPIQLNRDSIFCGIDTLQLRGRVDTIYDACPAKNGSKARMVIDRVTKCVAITGVNIGSDTMCVVVCNTASRICDTTFVIAVVRDTAGGQIIVIANDDFDSLRRGTNKTLELYNNDTLRPRRPTSLTIVTPPVKGLVDTISFANGLVKYTANRSPSACGLDSFRYRVCVDTVCDTALVVVLVVCPDSLQVWKALSPNGDGRNDVLLVEGLQNYPNNTVCVFNRWGNQVLNQKNYQNDWQGTWNGTNVPDGTYYYFIRNDDNGELLLTGYLQILR